MAKYSWKDTTFVAGDRMLLELEEHSTKDKTVVEWTVPSSYGEAPDPVDGDDLDDMGEWGGVGRQLANGDWIMDMSDEEGLGLFIGGDENIFPEVFRALNPGEHAIDISTLVPVDPDDLKVGDRIVISDASLQEYVIEFTLTDENFEDGFCYPAIGDGDIKGLSKLEGKRV
jgi:hypothetical protein